MKLTDLVDFNPRTQTPKTGHVPFLDMAALPTSGRDVPGFTLRAASGSGSKFRNGDTLLARITPCLENGKGAQVAGLPGVGVGQGSTEFIVLRAKDPADADFVYYLSREPAFRSFAIQQMSGTSGRQRVNWQSLTEYQIEDIGRSQRKAVGAILASLDDKIELNRRMNETLEAMAQAIFRDWFVDFGPVRRKLAGETDPVAIMGGLTPDPARAAELAMLFPARMDEDGLPEGWAAGAAGDLIEFNPKEPLKRGVPAPYSDMSSLPTVGSSADLPIVREFGSGTRFRNGDALLARITPCLENGKTALVDFLTEESPVGWGSTEFIVHRARPGTPQPLPYLLCRNDDYRSYAIQSMTGTSGRQRAQAERLEAWPMPIPTGPVLKAFGDFVDAFFARISASSRENRSLAETRDYLLPRLMSGQVRLNPSNTESAVA